MPPGRPCVFGVRSRPPAKGTVCLRLPAGETAPFGGEAPQVMPRKLAAHNNPSLLRPATHGLRQAVPALAESEERDLVQRQVRGNNLHHPVAIHVLTLAERDEVNVFGGRASYLKGGFSVSRSCVPMATSVLFRQTFWCSLSSRSLRETQTKSILATRMISWIASTLPRRGWASE